MQGKRVVAVTENRITAARVIECASEQFGVTIDQLHAPSRGATVVLPRHVAMFVARQLSGDSYPQLARAFGRQDHTTVMHAVRKIALLEESDPYVRGLVEELSDRCTKESA